MSPSPSLFRRVSATALLSMVACLPGCLTAALWDDDEDDENRAPAVTYELVQSQLHGVDGTLESRGPLLAGGLVVISAGAEAAWRLRPGLDADLAVILLDNPEACEVRLARIDAVRSYVGTEVIDDEAELELRAWWREGAIGSEMDASTLSSDVTELLSVPRRSGFAFAATPELYLPSLFRQCVERMQAADLGWVVTRAGAWHLESSVFVGPDDVVRFDPRNPNERYPSEQQLQGMPLREQLDVLASYSLIVRVSCVDESRYLRLRPDRIWLWSGFDRESGRVVHRSSWHLEPMIDGVGPATDESFRIAANMSLRQSKFVRHERDPWDGGSDFWAKVALTPLALTIDIALCWLEVFFLGDDGDDHDDPVGKEMRRQRERRAR